MRAVLLAAALAGTDGSSIVPSWSPGSHESGCGVTTSIFGVTICASAEASISARRTKLNFLANVVAQLMDNDADGVADAHVVAPSGLLEVNTGTLNLGTAGIQALVSQAPWTAPASTWTPSVVPDGSYAGNGMAAFGTSVRLPYPPPKPPSSPPLTPPGVDVAGVEMSAQNSLSDGALIGIGIGCAGLAVLLLLFVWRAKKAKAKTARPNAQSDVELPTVSQSHSTS